MKNTKGITLIALVITIIVLLILAGVTISMVVGNNGVLSQAKKSAQNTKIGEIKDEIELIRADYEVEHEGENPTAQYLLDKLFSRGKISQTQYDNAQDGETEGTKVIEVEGKKIIIEGAPQQYAIVYGGIEGQEPLRIPIIEGLTWRGWNPEESGTGDLKLYSTSMTLYGIMRYAAMVEPVNIELLSGLSQDGKAYFLRDENGNPVDKFSEILPGVYRWLVAE